MIMARVRRSRYIAVLIVSTIFAAATRIVGTFVTLLGIMAGASMNRAKYNVKLDVGTITAGGTLGILIPPLIILIVMGPVLEVSTIDLFRGAFFPGALFASLYRIYTLARCSLNTQFGPILSDEDQPETSKSCGAEVALVSLGILTLCRILAWVWVKILVLTGPSVVYLFSQLPLKVIFNVWMSFPNSGLAIWPLFSAVLSYFWLSLPHQFIARMQKRLFISFTFGMNFLQDLCLRRLLSLLH